jgi:hypothetical protein
MRPAPHSAARVVEGAVAAVLIVGVAALLFVEEEEPAAYGVLLVSALVAIAAAGTSRWRAVGFGFAVTVVLLVGAFLAMLLLFVGG